MSKAGAKNREELTRIKGTVTEQEFDRRYEEIQSWNKTHSFEKMTRPAEVELFKYKQ
jgi:hypothetical protein